MFKREQHIDPDAQQALHDKIVALESENLRLKVAMRNVARYLREVGLHDAANALERNA